MFNLFVITDSHSKDLYGQTMEPSFDEDIAEDTSRIVKDLSLFEAHIPGSSSKFNHPTDTSKMDPYLQKFNYLRINDDSDRSSHRVIVSESGYGRIIPKSIDSQGRSLSTMAVSASSTSPGFEVMTSGSKSLPASTIASPVRTVPDKNKHHAVGAIESFIVEASGKNQTADYKIYERGNIIAASKFATPKQVETIASNKLPAEGQCPANGSTDKYYPAYGAASPTHSLSGSSRDSQHSNSPRASLVQNYSSPLYENIDYYSANRTPQAPYYHSMPQQHSGSPHSSLGSQDSKHSSPRTSLADGGHYESSYRKAQPQVPSGTKYASSSSKDFPPYEAPPVYENIQELQHYSKNYEPAKPGPQVPSNYYSSTTRTGSPIPTSSRGNNLPPPPPYPGANNGVNAGDYVVMTGGNNTQVQLATSYQRGTSSGIANAVYVCPSPPVTSANANSNVSSSVNISASANTSTATKVKSMSGKTLLPYNVTPPRPMVNIASKL
ncbi:hypothetical protein C0J52_15147 [Blattella germanica]|nr:hypothetical protein C0J52_15147 [Blattella germanica]